jgi:hypothetical protein
VRHVDAQALAARTVSSVVSILPGNAEIAAVDVQRVGDAELLHGARERQMICRGVTL